MLLATLFGTKPFLKMLFADAPIKGRTWRGGSRKSCPILQTEIVKRSDQVQGFVVLPKRWIVERTILGSIGVVDRPGLGDLNRKGLAFLRLASIRLMLRKLCNPT